MISKVVPSWGCFNHHALSIVSTTIFLFRDHEHSLAIQCDMIMPVRPASPTSREHSYSRMRFSAFSSIFTKYLRVNIRWWHLNIWIPTQRDPSLTINPPQAVPGFTAWSKTIPESCSVCSMEWSWLMCPIEGPMTAWMGRPISLVLCKCLSCQLELELDVTSPAWLLHKGDQLRRYNITMCWYIRPPWCLQPNVLHLLWTMVTPEVLSSIYLRPGKKSCSLVSLVYSISFSSQFHRKRWACHDACSFCESVHRISYSRCLNDFYSESWYHSAWPSESYSFTTRFLL